MRIKKNLFYAVLLLVLAFTGCTFNVPNILGDTPPSQYYVLNDAGLKHTKTYQSLQTRLRLFDITASRFIKSNRILFKRDEHTLGFYQYASWVDTPPKRISGLLMERLEKSNLFSSVSGRASAVHADYQLNTELTEFYHDAADSPGEVVAELRVELVEIGAREIVGKKTFRSKVEAGRHDALGAVEVFDEAVAVIFDELLEWLAAELGGSQ